MSSSWRWPKRGQNHRQILWSISSFVCLGSRNIIELFVNGCGLSSPFGNLKGSWVRVPGDDAGVFFFFTPILLLSKVYILGESPCVAMLTQVTHGSASVLKQICMASLWPGLCTATPAHETLDLDCNFSETSVVQHQAMTQQCSLWGMWSRQAFLLLNWFQVHITLSAARNFLWFFFFYFWMLSITRAWPIG